MELKAYFVCREIITISKEHKRELIMKKIIERFSNLVKDSISEFNYIVFKGFILPLMLAKELMRFGVLKAFLIYSES